MLIGIGLPQELGEAGGQRLTAFARRAEDLGFDSLWVQDQVFGHRPRTEPLMTLSAIAAETRRCYLGTAAVVVPGRHPVELARLAGTLQGLSGGRLILGLASGSRWTAQRLGLQPDNRLPMLRETVQMLRTLWSGSAVSATGEHWSLDRATLRLTDSPMPPPPLLMGGGSGAALRFAAARGDGWIGAGSSGTAIFETQLRRLRHELAAQRSSADHFVIAKRLYYHVGRANRDRARVRQWFASYYGDGALVEAAVVGSADDCMAAARQIVELGVGHLILSPVVDEEAQMEHAAELLQGIRLPPTA